jgi:hypothetical protein
MNPGTKVRLLDPIFDPISRLMGIHVAWVPAGEIGVVDSDGQTVLFANGTPGRLAEIRYAVVPEAQKADTTSS